MRTGTRSSGEVMRYYKFKSTMKNCPDHTPWIPDNRTDYYMICNVRNPYSRFVSLYYMNMNYLENYDIKFEEWLKIHSEKYRELYRYTISEKVQKKPDYLVRMETFLEDIKSIFFVDLQDLNFIKILENNIEKNGFTKEYSDQVERKFWKTFYNQELADLVYEKTKSDFETYNYDKNSWK